MRGISAIAAALLIFATEVSADCDASGYSIRVDSTTSPTLFNKLNTQAINATAPGVGGENWKEVHCNGGDLQKVGLGPSDAVDPQVSVGSWNAGSAATSLDTVTYNYGTGGSYTWRVYTDNLSGSNLCWQQNTDGGNVIAIGSLQGVLTCVSP